MRARRKRFRTSTLVSLFLPVAAFLLLAPSCKPPCPPVGPVEIPEFMLGTSQGGMDVIPLVSELGAGWMRTSVTWKTVEPVIVERDLTVEEVDRRPEMVAEYLNVHDWSGPDAMLSEMQAHGLKPLVIVGHGYNESLPYFEGALLTPDRIGRENYLGHIYLFARAAVERYNGDGENDAPGGQVVKFYQLDNEVNQAFLTAVWGWRPPNFLAAFGSAWRDWEFVTRLVETLSQAVNIEDSDAWTTVNFHTDVPASLNAGLGLPSWKAAIRQWAHLIDIIGIDAYPNYYSPEPVMGETLGERVAAAARAGCGKPVVVVETGYPTGPSERGYTEEAQALYIRQAYEASVAAGAQGFFLFGVKTGERHDTEITPEDVANLEYLSDLYDQGAFFKLLFFAIRNVDYLQDHFVNVLQTVEPYWGLVRLDGTRKPGWDVFRAIADG